MPVPIPSSVKLHRNKASEGKLLAASRKWLEREERTEGIHASDILNPRQAFWRRTLGDPLDDRKVTTFLIGKVLHAFVLGTMDAGNVDLNKTDEGSSFSEELGIWYSPDWDKGDVAEFKTSRSFKEPQSLGDVESYIQQLLIYMAAKHRTTAELWVLYLNLKDDQRRTDPQFRAYTVQISESDLDGVRSKIRSTKADLDKAIETGNPEALELCWSFICNERLCPFWHKCKPPGRYPE